MAQDPERNDECWKPPDCFMLMYSFRAGSAMKIQEFGGTASCRIWLKRIEREKWRDFLVVVRLVAEGFAGCSSGAVDERRSDSVVTDPGPKDGRWSSSKSNRLPSDKAVGRVAVSCLEIQPSQESTYSRLVVIRSPFRA